MIKKLFFGFLVSSFFLFLTFRDVDSQSVVVGVSNLNYAAIPVVLLLLVLVMWMRSYRWGLILSSVIPLTQKELFPVTCLGFMAITIMPVRTGEVVRPYLISSKKGVAFSAVFATVVVERVIDSFFIVIMLLLVFFETPLPPLIVAAAKGFIMLFFIMFILVGAIYIFSAKHFYWGERFIDKLPSKIQLLTKRLFTSFSEGLLIIGRPIHLLYIFCLSVVIWAIGALTVYCCFYIVNLHLHIMAAVVVLVITLVGISLPSAPGFLGNFQYACLMGLSLYNIPRDDAIVFSLVYYILGIGVQIGLGILFINSFDYKEMWSAMQRKTNNIWGAAIEDAK